MRAHSAPALVALGLLVANATGQVTNETCEQATAVTIGNRFVEVFEVELETNGPACADEPESNVWY